MKVQLPQQSRVRIEIIPLIDIVFLLLVFFIHAMLSMAVHRALPVSLPTSKMAKPTKEEVASITISKDGSIFLEKIPVRLEELAYRLKASNKSIVSIFADKHISYQLLFNVLDKINEAGMNKISLQAKVE